MKFANILDVDVHELNLQNQTMTSAKKFNSPYSVALGGGFLFEETDVILPLLQSEDCDALLKDEIQHNRLLQTNTEPYPSKGYFGDNVKIQCTAITTND